jgi:hypothetical protein
MNTSAHTGLITGINAKIVATMAPKPMMFNLKSIATRRMTTTIIAIPKMVDV